MKLDDRGDNNLYTWGSKKKKSNGRGVCSEFRRLRKRARQGWRRLIDQQNNLEVWNE